MHQHLKADTNSPTMASFSGMSFRLHSTCLTLAQSAYQNHDLKKGMRSDTIYQL